MLHLKQLMRSASFDASTEFNQRRTMPPFQRTVPNKTMAVYTRDVRERFAGSTSPRLREPYQPEAHEIISRVFLGSLRAAFDLDFLRTHNIKFVLTVAEGFVEFLPVSASTSEINMDGDSEASVGNDYERPHYPFVAHAVQPIVDYDEERILEHLANSLSFIDECLTHPEQGAVLVHCAAGVSRSATVVIAYLMTRKGMSLNEALRLVQDKRPVAYPNTGFRIQLEELERCKGNIYQAKKKFAPNTWRRLRRRLSLSA